MPQKNQGKGGKRRRRGKKVEEPIGATKITTKADASKGEKYGKVIKLAGDCRIAVETPTNESYICHIPGKFRKRVWIKQGDIVLFCVRPFEAGKSEKGEVPKGDILSLYAPDEIRWLTQKKELPSNFSNIELNTNNDGNQDIMWNEEGAPMTLSEEELENDSDVAEDEKVRLRQERIARNAVPQQERMYEMPPSDSEEGEEGDIKENVKESITVDNLAEIIDAL